MSMRLLYQKKQRKDSIMNIIKRDGKEVVFDVMKIIEAISKANEEVDPGTPDNPNRLSKK